MPARNDECEGPDPRAVSALDCFALSGLAMTTRAGLLRRIAPRNDDFPDASPPNIAAVWQEQAAVSRARDCSGICEVEQCGA
jgi:hypothetical protein